MKNKKILTIITAFLLAFAISLSACESVPDETTAPEIVTVSESEEESSVDESESVTEETEEETEESLTEDETEEETEEESSEEETTAEETEEETKEETTPETTGAPTQSSQQPTPTYNATSINGKELVEYVSQYIGKTPYLWGGESLTNGADCSGVIVAAYRHFGVNLPHYSGSLTDQGNFQRVSADEILPGDIVGQTGGVAIFAGYDYVEGPDWSYQGDARVPAEENYSFMALVSSDMSLYIKKSDVVSFETYPCALYDVYKYKIPESQGGYRYVAGKSPEELQAIFDSSEYINVKEFLNLEYIKSVTYKDGKSYDDLVKYRPDYPMVLHRTAVIIGFPSETPGVKLTQYNALETSGYRMITNTAPDQKDSRISPNPYPYNW